MLRIKWNEINPHRRSDFTRRRRISRPQGISQVPQGFISLKKSSEECTKYCAQTTKVKTRKLFLTLKLVKSEISRCTSMWNNSLRELWYLMLRIKWNEINPHRRSDFTRRRRISRPQGISQIPKGIYFVEKSTCNRKCFFHGGHARTRTVDLLRVKQAL